MMKTNTMTGNIKAEKITITNIKEGKINGRVKN